MNPMAPSSRVNFSESTPISEIGPMTSATTTERDVMVML